MFNSIFQAVMTIFLYFPHLDVQNEKKIQLK